MAYTTIDDPTIYFNTLLWTGNGVDGRALTGVGFQPDWVWIKDRDDTESHRLTDSVRGATKSLRSNGTNAEATESDGLQSFDSDGFTVGTQGSMNKSNGDKFVGWSWKAGGSASSNSNGDITSSVSANTTAGFSIVSYTGSGTKGDTVGHGLGVAPKVIMVKSRSLSVAWLNYHSSLGATDFIQLNNTDATTNSSGNAWNDTQPTSSVFSIGSYNNVNTSGATYIAYCFAEKKGYSKFGSYVGNGNNDGTFIYTGFKPAWFLIKSSSNAEQWEMVDNKRNTINPLNLLLYPDQSAAEFTGSTGDRLHCDFVSNGVKLRGNASSANGSGLTYIYMAFAENPFVTSTGIPTTAR